MIWPTVALVLLAACGRIGFDTGDDRPTFDVDLRDPTSPGLRTQRNTPATYVGADKLIHSAGTNEPRYDNDPLKGMPLGLLIEPAATNMIVFSDKLDVGGAGWFTNFINTDITINIDATVAPDGTMSAEEIVDNDATGDNRRAQIVTVADDTENYTYSIFLKAGTCTTRTFGAELLDGTNQIQTEMDVDLAVGTITRPPPSADDYGIAEYSDGWYRVWITLRNNALGNITGVLSVWDCLHPNSALNGSVYAWGGQVERGPFATSYIPSPGGAVTVRDADTIKIEDPAFMSPDAGSWLVTSQLAHRRTTNQPLLCFNTTNGARCLGRDGATATTLVSSNGSALLRGSGWADGIPRTIVGSYERADVTLHEAKQTESSIGMFSLADLSFISVGSSATDHLDGWISRLTYWPYALAPADLSRIGVQ